MLAATFRRAASAAVRRVPAAARPVQRRFAQTAAAAEEGVAAKKPSFMDSLPKHPDYQGVEAVVRYFLPHNGQISIAVVGLYAFLITWGMSSSKASAIQKQLNAPAPEYPAFEDVVSKEVTGFPSMVEDTEAWVEFISDESNLDALIESLESM